MCGLFGIIASPEALLDTPDRNQFVALGAAAQRRGSDASGIVLLPDAGPITVVKSDLPFRQLANSSAGHDLLEQVSRAFAVFGHSRLETHGFSASVVNNQPVIVGEWVVLHNGIITNHQRIRQANPHVPTPGIESDTAAIGVVLTDWDERGRPDSDRIFRALEGEFSIIAMSTSGDVLAHTNVGNLYSLRRSDGSVMLASEPRMFDSDGRDSAVRLELNTTVVLRQRIGTVSVPVRVTESEASTRRSFAGAEGLHLLDDGVNHGFAQRVEALSEAAAVRSATLRRCRTCILPATFPNLAFDDTGQCAVCSSYSPPSYSGVDAFTEALRAASPDGRRAVVCLSGGRDSCYALHLVCELGFKPIAYTYDWGMVTTAARENMARMCGTLGVEHVLVSPNIRKNRLRIRRALTAWLRRPDVATLPILMAGDKPYFRYAATVAEERGDLPAVMADHPLETTGFKSMLAGARPSRSESGGVSYRLNRASLARMIGSYGLHALRSPGLIPSLFAEGAVGFFDYYVREHTFVRPFSFIQWDEETIEATLRGTYGWSAGEERSATSWRMGDGTAPFYNLMYLLALGMSEHDALRSNQVRAGLITREMALDRASADNRIHPVGLASYFATVDVDPMWSLDQIERFATACGVTT